MRNSTRELGKVMVFVLSIVVIGPTMVGASRRPPPQDEGSYVLPEPAVATPRVLYVDRILTQRSIDLVDGPTTAVDARLQAAGLSRPSARVQLQLRDRQGALIKVRSGTSPQYVRDGRYCYVFDAVLSARASEPKTFVCPIPDGILDLSPDRRRYVIAQASASCGSLANTTQALIALMPPRRTLAFRAIRIARAAVLTEMAPPDLNVAGMGEDWFRVPAEPTADRTLSVHLELDGLQDQRLVVLARLIQDGQPVKAAPGAATRHRDDQGRFVSRFESGVPNDRTRLPGINLSIPRKALNLPAGQDHRVTVLCSATCGGLTATWSDVTEIPASALPDITVVPEPPEYTPSPEGTPLDDEPPRLAVTRMLLTDGVLDKNTELLQAAGAGDAPVVRFLLAQGADRQTRGGAGRMPLHLAAANGHREVVEAFLESPRPPDPSPDTADRLSPTQDIFSPDFKENTRQVDSERQTVSLDSSTQAPSFDQFLAENTIINATDDQQMTPLHLAAHAGHDDVVTLLLSNGADVNATDATGLTPLHLAALAAHQAVARTLLAAGADPWASSVDGSMPIDLAPATAIKATLRQSMPGERPDERAIKKFISGFLDAVRKRDAAAVMLLATPQLAAKLPQKILPVQFQYRILSTRPMGAHPQAVVWVQVPDLPSGQNELAMTFHLQRYGQTWRIAEIDTDPYIESIHGREVRQ